MAKKNRLLKSVITATIFHWVWITALFFSLDIFQTKGLLKKAGLDFNEINITNQLSYQIDLFVHWVPLALSTTTIAVVFGFISAWVYAKHTNIKFKKRMSGNGIFRGVGTTLGELPMPESPTIKEIDIELPSDLKLSNKHYKLLCDLLSIINDSNVPAGVGHADVSLLEHTLDTIDKAIKYKRKSQNTICAIAAHDIGKIRTFKKNAEGNWVTLGKHDDEGANIIRTLESWWNLSEEDRFTILYAVKYSHKPTSIPHEIPYKDSITKCVEDVRHIDHNVTKKEKEKNVEKIENEKSIYDVFLEFLQSTPLRTSTSPAGQKAGGWIKHGCCFVLENYFKDTYLKENNPEILAAYNELGRKVHHSKVTRELLRQLDEKGMLVKEYNDEKITSAKDALWVIKCGKIQFIKIIIIPLTKEVLQLVGDNTYHKPLSVISSYKKYQRDNQQNAKKKPAAREVNTNTVAGKIQEDKAKLIESKKTSSDEINAPSGNNRNKKEGASKEPNKKTKNNSKKRQKHKQVTSSAPDEDDTIDNMFSSFASPPKEKPSPSTEIPNKQTTDKPELSLLDAPEIEKIF